jgi:hypothetical protein
MGKVGVLESALLLTLAVAGCSDSTSVNLGGAPTLPAAESMDIDLTFFSSPSPGPAAAPAQVAGTNFAAAAVRVAAANLAVVVHTAIPLATWKAARAQTPVFENGKWHWRFSTDANGQSYSGDLTGYVESGDLIAEMRITASSLGLNNVLWYVGTAPVGGTTGTWEFFDPQSPSTPVGMIDWSHPATLVWTVSFIAMSGADEGDELTYDVDGNARSVSYTDASAGTSALIEWNAATHTGSITAPNYNGGAKACWDATLANATCP